MPTTCTCANGSPVTAADCAFDGLAKCSACDDGYRLITDTDASAATNTDQFGNAYQIVNAVCTANECGCASGAAVAVGHTSCNVHGANVCASCDNGHQLTRENLYIELRAPYAYQ